jgi:hypothetical protein
MAEDRERMAGSTEYITLAVSRRGMGYCFPSLSLLERVGVREAKTMYPGETFVSTHTRNILLSAWFICALLVCMASTTAWSDSDKTTVDLERGLPEAPSRYHRPRAARLYQYDKTEVDLAVPLPQQPAEEQRGSQRPATLTTPMPAPTMPPSQAPHRGEDAKGQLAR